MLRLESTLTRLPCPAVSEIFLRLACGLVGWLLVLSHGLLLAVVPVASCNRELFATTLVFAGFAAISAVWLLPAALRFREHLRWSALPAVGLWAWAAWSAWPLLTATTLAGLDACQALAGAPSGEARPATLLERAWAPLQLLVVAACGRQALRYWAR